MRLLSATSGIANLVLGCVLLWSAGTTVAMAETAAPPEAPATLNAVDFNFVGQSEPWRTLPGRTRSAGGNEGHERCNSQLRPPDGHEPYPVVDALNVILKKKDITPSNTLLHGAYDAMIFTLKADQRAAFDRNYVNGQVEYQKGNAALFEQEIQNGSDPDLKEFARQTLPKIVDHLHRAESLQPQATKASSRNEVPVTRSVRSTDILTTAGRK